MDGQSWGESVAGYIDATASAMWDWPLLVILLPAGIFLTIRLRLVQLRRLKHGFQLISGKYDDPKDEGEISHLQALSAALSATIGTGNIVGVATAIAGGGPGAVFWMWVTGVFGMVHKFTSATLGLKYRVVHPDGSISGGPMYYIEKGLGYRWLAIMFAVCTMFATFGIGCMVQSNAVASAVHTTWGVPVRVTGLVMAVLVALVVFGGIRRIAQLTVRLTPAMCVIYVLGALIVLVKYAGEIPEALSMIFSRAFTAQAGLGAFAGVTVQQTIRHGVARGVFSNEGGLGSAAIAHAAAKTKEPVREGLVAMVGPLIDTLIICTMTALVILVTGAWTHVDATSGLVFDGADLSGHAFEVGLGRFGAHLVTIGLCLFAFSTVLSWPYYGDRSAEYLFGPKVVPYYRLVHVALLVVGAEVALKVVWHVADILNGMMAFPNLVGIVGLSGIVARELGRYFQSGGDKRIRPADEGK
jgi:AGCS family alanine or glycine:cation symporter